jgi:hypothetical protein
MTFQKALFNKIKTDIPALKLYYGNAFNVAPPYFVMFPVTSSLKGEVFCDSDDAGEILLQFSYVSNLGAGPTEDGLEQLHALVKGIIGNIIYSGVTYQIWENVTEGIRLLGGASNNTWDAIFETRLKYKEI